LDGKADYIDGIDHYCIGYSSLTMESLRRLIPTFGVGCIMNGFPDHPGAQYAGRKNDEF
jgi:hypothetical protein